MTELAFYAWYVSPVLAVAFCGVVYLLAAHAAKKEAAELDKDRAPAE